MKNSFQNPSKNKTDHKEKPSSIDSDSDNGTVKPKDYNRDTDTGHTPMK